MKKFYIYIEEIEGITKAEDYAIFAENKEDAVHKYIHSCKLGLTSYDFDEDDEWRIFAKEIPDYVDNYYAWQREIEDYEIVGRRPIEL